MNATQKLIKWQSYLHPNSNEFYELDKIKNDPIEIEDRFSSDISFGTGGVRGLMGQGSNRINQFTVARITQGIANHLANLFDGRELSVCVGFDTRNHSKEFASVVKNILIYNKIKVHMFSNPRPTPLLSFSVKYLKADIGIMITASHNPKEYNGYKVFNSNGIQVTDTLAYEITNEIQKVEIGDIFSKAKLFDQSSLVDNTLENIELRYLDSLKTIEIINNNAKKDNSLKIVYTPLHGTGLSILKDAFTRFGFRNLSIVKNQSTEDGNFPTVQSPNPEEASAFKLSLEMAKEVKADLVLATDPDADRVGIAVKHNNEYVLLNGNQVATLLVHFICSTKKTNQHQYIIKTIVTSDLPANIANNYGVRTHNTLTGFKYIGELAYKLDQGKNFLLGFEESFGYLSGAIVGDKDAIFASILICQMAEHYKRLNLSLIDQLDLIYKEFGYYQEALVSFTFKTESEKQNSIKMFKNLRDFDFVVNYFDDIIRIEDFESQLLMTSNSATQIMNDLPKSNVIKLILNDHSWLAIRPSGTEPKLKVYYSANAKTDAACKERLKKISSSFSALMEAK